MNVKKTILILIICIALISTLLASILINLIKEEKSNNNSYRDVTDKEYQEFLKNAKFGELVPLDNATTFFTVISCIENYMSYNNQKDAEKIYNVLAEEYIEQNNITKENVLSKVDIYDKEEVYFTAKEINEYYNSENIYTYFVYGEVKQTEYESDDIQRNDIYVALQLDVVNRTFDIFLNEKAEDNGYSKSDKKEHIIENEDNLYETAETKEDQIGLVYFNDFINNLRFNIDKAYQDLNEEYRLKRFSTIEEFKKYVNSFDMSEYAYAKATSVADGEKKVYTITDNFENIYIFEENAILDYTVQMDNYTIENEEFNTLYKSKEYMDRGVLNVNRFFQMLSMQDYKSAYNVLDENFKQTYFKTQDDFENYIKANFFRYNKVTFTGYQNDVSSLHVYSVNVCDVLNEDTRTLTFNIIIKLGEGTDFTMSFGS